MRRKTLASKTSLDVEKLNNSDILKPTEALSVRAFISVFGFGPNLFRFCDFRRFFARFLKVPYDSPPPPRPNWRERDLKFLGSQCIHDGFKSLAGVNIVCDVLM